MELVTHDFFTINIGQVISVFAFLGGAVMVWQKMKDKLESVEDITKRNTQELDTMSKLGLTTIIQQHERRLTQIEASIDDIREMRTDIRWIKARLGKDDPQ